MEKEMHMESLKREMRVADKFGQGKKVATPRMCCRVSGSRWWVQLGGRQLRLDLEQGSCWVGRG